MSITAKQYAIALIECLRGKKETEAKVLIKEFVSILSRNNDLGKEEEIINELFDLWQSESGVLTVDVESARNLSDASEKVLKSFLQQKFKAKKIIIQKKLNKKILGGAIVKYKDKIWDMSIATRLEKMREEMCR